jgi:hypothetical protein
MALGAHLDSLYCQRITARCPPGRHSATFRDLDAIAKEMADNETAEQLHTEQAESENDKQ